MKRFALLLLISCLVLARGEAPRDVAPPPAGLAPYALMDFSKPMAIDALPQGWHQRKFHFVKPMQISYVDKAGRPAIRLQTNNSASMLFHDVNIGLDRRSILSWGWFVYRALYKGRADATAPNALSEAGRCRARRATP